MAESLTFTTLGELIKGKRTELGVSLSELGRVSGVSKGVISKIETGETRRPELKTLKSLSEALEIPYEEIMDRYIDIEHRIDILGELLFESIELSNNPLITKVSQQIMESPNEDTYIILQHLYDLSSTVADNEAKLTIYDVIIKYARLHGVPKYIAKGLLQKYFIESQNLKKKEKSFKSGEEILYYTDFLDQEEKINFYYLMAFDAHGIGKYEQCIKLGKMGHAEDTTNNEVKERVALAICNAYSRMGNYTALEEHLNRYAELNFDFVIKRIKYYRAIILSNTGQEFEAIPLLKECVEEAEDNHRLHRVNDLLEVLLKVNDLYTAQQILDKEEKNTFVKLFTAYKISELGKYYRLKGTFLVRNGLFNQGMESYLKAMDFYSKINDRSGIMKCSEKVYAHHNEQSKVMELGLLKRLQEVYNVVNKG